MIRFVLSSIRKTSRWRTLAVAGLPLFVLQAYKWPMARQMNARRLDKCNLILESYWSQTLYSCLSQPPALTSGFWLTQQWCCPLRSACINFLINLAYLCYWHQGCTPRPAPALGEMAAPGRPGPENFQLCPAPPRLAPEKEGAKRPKDNEQDSEDIQTTSY